MKLNIRQTLINVWLIIIGINAFANPDIYLVNKDGVEVKEIYSECQNEIYLVGHIDKNSSNKIEDVNAEMSTFIFLKDSLKLLIIPNTENDIKLDFKYYGKKYSFKLKVNRIPGLITHLFYGNTELTQYIKESIVNSKDLKFKISIEAESKFKNIAPNDARYELKYLALSKINEESRTLQKKIFVDVIKIGDNLYEFTVPEEFLDSKSFILNIRVSLINRKNYLGETKEVSCMYLYNLILITK